MLINNAVITGSFIVNGVDVTGITGSSNVSSSYLALSASFLVTSASYASASGSLSTRVTNLESTSSTVSSSFATTSGSLSIRVTNLESTSSTVSSSFVTTSGSLSTRVTNLESTSSVVSSSFATTSGSIAGRVTTIESKYATTGSNTFTAPQQISDVSNAISFTSTASLYAAGGLRVSRDSFVSGTAYFNNIVVYGTSSIQYITSSQLDISDNIIAVNTFTPAIRFGGLAVYDSGSTGLTGSLLWDSEKDKWVYSNPSGSTYDGGMLISGPRNTTGLGNEVGTTSCALMMGQGGDHITSSAIFSYGNATCFYGTTVITGSGAVCTTMVNASCIGVGTTTPSQLVDVYKTSNDAIVKVSTCAAGAYFAADSQGTDGYYGLVLQNNGTDRWLIGGYATTDFTLNTARTGGSRYLTISRATGLACFSGTVCAQTLAFCSSVNNGFTSIRICNPNPGSSAFSEVAFFNDTTNQAGLFYNSSTRSSDAGVCSFSMYNDSATGNIRLRSGGNIVLATGTPSAADRLTINTSGVACFACQVCSGVGFYASSLQSGVTIDSTTNGDTIIASRGLNAALHGIVRTVGQNGVTCMMMISTRNSVDGNLPASVNAIWGLTNNDMVIATCNVERMRITNAGIACFASTVCASRFFTSGIGTFLSAVCSNYMITFCDTGDTRYLQSYVGTPATYNPASSGTVNKIVSGLSFNWYSECWLMGATRGGGADIDSFVLGRNGATNLVVSSGGNLGLGTPNPGNRLTICNNGNSVIAFRINDTNANSSFLSLNASNTDSAIIAGGTSAIPFDIYTGGSVRMRMNSNGIACFACQICTPSVGIGIGATTSPLQVFGGGASTMLQTGTQRYTLFGKYIQSYAGAAVNIPLLVACGMANTGILVKAYIYGTNAVGSQRYEDAGYAGIYYIGGGFQGSNAAVTTICNLGGVGHTVGVLYWGNTGSNPVLYYCQGNNGYIGESIDLYVTIRDSANVYFYPDQIVCG